MGKMRRAGSIAILLWLVAAPTEAARLVEGQSGEVRLADRAEAYYQFVLGRQFEKAGEIERALAAYRRALELDPATVELNVEVAALYARLNRPEEALAVGEAALGRAPDNPRLHRVLGLVYAALATPPDDVPVSAKGDPAAGYHARAVEHLERAVAGGETDGRVLATLGELHLSAGRPEQAVEVLARLVAQDPERLDGYLLLGRAYEAAGRRDQAVAVLETAVAVEPESVRALVALADLYGRLGRWREAAEVLEDAAERAPRNFGLRRRWARALIGADDPARAETVLGEVLAAQATDVEALFLLGVARQARREYLAAAEAFRRAAALAPEATAVKASLASALISARRFDEAAEVLRAARAQAPDDLAVLFQQGALFERQGRYKDAEAVFRQVIERDARHAPALNYLGYMLAERGERLEESTELVRRALEIDPGNPAYLDSLGWAYFKLRRFDLAEPPLRRASEALPTNSVVQAHWGELLFELGRYEEAVAAWQRALAGDREDLDPEEVRRKIERARDRLRRRDR